MKILVIVDMQIDFCKPEGSLYNPAAETIIPKIANRLAKAKENEEFIIFTKDTHFIDYLNTLEGKKLPIPHCIKGTIGREIVPELNTDNCAIVSKTTFGDIYLSQSIKEISSNTNDEVEEIEICGTVSSICILANCILFRAFFPNTRIIVNKNLIADITDEGQQATITCLKAQQIDIIEED